MILPKNEYEFYVAICTLELLNLGIISSIVYFNFRKGLRKIGNRCIDDLLRFIPVTLLILSGIFFYLAGWQGLLGFAALDIFSCLVAYAAIRIIIAQEARFDELEKCLLERNIDKNTEP